WPGSRVRLRLPGALSVFPQSRVQSMSVQQRLCILGSTGSIGVSTLDVVARHPDRFSVHALSAHSRIEALAEQAARHAARVVVVPDDAARARFVAAWPAGRPLPEIRQGSQALADTAAD